MLFSLLLCSLAWTGAHAAGELDAIFNLVEQANWGAKKQAVKQKINDKALLDSKTIVIVPDKSGLSSKGTINYLFNEKTGGFYNLAWFAITPIKDVEATKKFENELEKALKAKYGKASYITANGRASDAKKIEKEMTKKMAEKDELYKAIGKAEAEKGQKLTAEEMMKIKTAGGKTMLDFMPTLFYSELNFWDAGNLWVYTSLLCSTDGDCYHHLQFVSKEQTKNETYAPDTKKAAFSYTPLDRDQDSVTKHNRTLQGK